MKRDSSARAIHRYARPCLKNALAIGLTMFLLALGIPAFGTPPEKGVNTVNNEGYATPLSKMNITIEKKSLDRIYTLSGSFAVSPETLVLGLDGKEMGIRKMLVPCDAEVSYTVENGGRMAYRIDVVRVADGASWQWTSEKPE